VKEVAVGIIRKDGRVLACQRRADVPYPLKWEFPGGKIESGETASAALERELREELNIGARIGPLLHTQEWTYPGVPDRDGSFKIHYYLVSAPDRNPVNNAFNEIRWVTPDELQGMDILEGNREAVNLLVNHAALHEEG
jgi:8-oxo-dGTP diphosphatase